MLSFHLNQRWIASVCIVIGLAAVGRLTAQAQYRFDHWTADNGLPQNSVRDILQTRDGYLWLTTFDGLVRFDGVRFTVFNKSNSPGIVTNRFLFLYEDGQGDLWATTDNSGLTRLHAGRFTTYTAEQWAPLHQVTSVGGDGNGNVLWFVGPRLLRWAEGKFLPAEDWRVTAQWGQMEYHQHVPCYTESGVASCFVGGQMRRWNVAALPVGNGPPRQDQFGQLWYSSDAGLVQLRDGQPARLLTTRDGLPGNRTHLIYGSEKLQALTFGVDGGLWLTDVNALQSESIAAQVPDGFEIKAVYGDREDNFWVGTFRNGLYRLRKQAVTAYSRGQGLKAEEIYPIYEDRNGAIWIGSVGEGVFRFQDGVFTQTERATNQWWNSITSIHEDRAGQLRVNGFLRLANGRLTPDGGLLQAVHGQPLGNLSTAEWPDSLQFCWTMHEDDAGAFLVRHARRRSAVSQRRQHAVHNERRPGRRRYESDSPGRQGRLVARQPWRADAFQRWTLQEMDGTRRTAGQYGARAQTGWRRYALDWHV